MQEAVSPTADVGGGLVQFPGTCVSAFPTNLGVILLAVPAE